MQGVVERLDEAGRPAWIIAMIAGFIVFFPLGVAILAFLIWSGRMSCGSNNAWGEHRAARWQRKVDRMQERVARWQEMGNRAFSGGFASTGNRAFDEYRHDTIRRLEDEAHEFRAFLDRLRQARDKAEFDQFMAERRGAGKTDVETHDRRPEDDQRPS